MKLTLAEDLPLPLEAVTEVLAFLGRRGQGKSYAAQRLAELFHGAGAQFVVLDPVGNWYGLRLAADGKGPGIPIPVFGGLQGDVPLEATAGRLVADLVVDRGISVVLDVSQFESDAEKARFARDFGERFFFRRKQAPAAVHVFLEEAQEFVPQNPGDEETKMLHAFQRMAKLGRNYGIGLSLISQRPQEVHKKVLNLTELLFAFQLTGKHERKAVAEWIRDKAIDEDIDQELPRLERGHPHTWSPAWLKISKVVAITAKETFDASSTPRVGKAAGPARALSPIDLDQLRQDMAATLERAKAEDPKELRRQLAERDREIRQLKTGSLKPQASTERVVEQRVEVPILKDAQVGRLERFGRQLESTSERLVAASVEQCQRADQLMQLANGLRSVGQDLTQAIRVALDGRKAIAPARPATAPVMRASYTSARRPVPEQSAHSGTSDLSPVGQRILDALAELEAIGSVEPPKPLVALLAGYTNLGSKGFRNAISALSSGGLVRYIGDRRVALTAPGRAQAAPVETPRTPGEVQDRICQLVGGASEKILRPLIAVYPQGIEREALGAESGYTNTGSKGFRNALSRLRSLGFVDYDGGTVVAQPVLFLEEARR